MSTTVAGYIANVKGQRSTTPGNEGKMGTTINQPEPDLTPNGEADLEIDGTPDLRAKIGRRLGAIRKDRKISQEDAARGANLSRPHLSNIELGRSRGGWAGLKAVAAFYDVDIKELAHEVQGLPVPEPSRRLRGVGPLAGAGFASNASEPLSEEERILLYMWRHCSEDERRGLLGQLLVSVGSSMKP